MAWIEVHDDIADHIKTQELARRLHGEITECVGILVQLWLFTLRVSWKNGDLTGYTSTSISHACRWTKDPDLLIKALQDSGYLDGMQVHDWQIYARETIRNRMRFSKRAEKTRRKPRKSTENTALPNHTIPNHTIPNKKKDIPPLINDVIDHMKDEIEAKKFFVYYESNGWRVGRNPMKNWRAAATGWLARNVQKGTVGGKYYTPQQESTLRELAEMRDRRLADEAGIV